MMARFDRVPLAVRHCVGDLYVEIVPFPLSGRMSYAGVSVRDRMKERETGSSSRLDVLYSIIQVMLNIYFPRRYLFNGPEKDRHNQIDPRPAWLF